MNMSLPTSSPGAVLRETAGVPDGRAAPQRGSGCPSFGSVFASDSGTGCAADKVPVSHDLQGGDEAPDSDIAGLADGTQTEDAEALETPSGIDDADISDLWGDPDQEGDPDPEALFPHSAGMTPVPEPRALTQGYDGLDGPVDKAGSDHSARQSIAPDGGPQSAGDMARMLQDNTLLDTGESPAAQPRESGLLATGGIDATEGRRALPPIEEISLRVSQTRDADRRAALIMDAGVSSPPLPAGGAAKGQPNAHATALFDILPLAEETLPGEAEFGVLSEQRPGTSPVGESRVSPPQTFMRADNARHVAFQISEAVQRGGDGSIDLLLNPSELGRVRITLSAGENGMIVTVVAERAETLELMRRHSDMLAQDFRDMGYDGAEFAFGHGDPQTAEPERRPPGAGAGHAETEPTSPTIARLAILPTDRIDIRL